MLYIYALLLWGGDFCKHFAIDQAHSSQAQHLGNDPFQGKNNTQFKSCNQTLAMLKPAARCYGSWKGWHLLPVFAADCSNPESLLCHKVCITHIKCGAAMICKHLKIQQIQISAGFGLPLVCGIKRHALLILLMGMNQMSMRLPCGRPCCHACRLPETKNRTSQSKSATKCRDSSMFPVRSILATNLLNRSE